MEEYEKQEKKVLEPKVARMINSVLSDNKARTFAYGSDNWLTLDSRPVAAKTGTTNDYRDAWTVGYTPSLITGVWVGNNNNNKMARGASGGNAAAPIWNKFMDKVLGDTPAETFNSLGEIKTGKPAIDGELEYTKTVKIDKVSGLLATEHTPEKYIKEVEYPIDPHCILYYVDKKDPLGEKPENPSKDPQFNLWEKAVQKWSKENNFTPTSSQEIPTEHDNVHKPEFKPKIQITEPGNKETITGGAIEVKVKTSAPKGVDKVKYYLNNHLFQTLDSYPFNLGADIDFLKSGYHELRAYSCDEVGNCAGEKILFNYKNSSNKQNAKPDASWIKPKSNLSLNPSNFPFVLKLKVTNSFKAAKITILAEQTGTSSPQTQSLKTVSPFNSSFMEFSLEKPLKNGSYKVHPRIYTWDGETINASEIYLNISN